MNKYLVLINLKAWPNTLSLLDCGDCTGFIVKIMDSKSFQNFYLGILEPLYVINWVYYISEKCNKFFLYSTRQFLHCVNTLSISYLYLGTLPTDNNFTRCTAKIFTPEMALQILRGQHKNSQLRIRNQLIGTNS